MLPRKLLFAVGLACFAISFPSVVLSQDSNAQSPSVPAAPTPLLRRVAVKHHGFTDATLNDAIVEKEGERLGQLKDRQTVEAPYDQAKVNRMSRALEDFWKERGISVVVRITLTQVPNEPRYAILTFEVLKQ
ncbi:MAG TPA: hypothetical protein VEI73_14020 [Candidatus Acidoferrum sp.]|nr:hypothetical protein [Candidatus Acidoferrum sp.]